ncbi:hypothetical protein [Acetobacter tropicalis]|nr:hypothetical protein [Acetobacter tropicalis]
MSSSDIPLDNPFSLALMEETWTARQTVSSHKKDVKLTEGRNLRHII